MRTRRVCKGLRGVHLEASAGAVGEVARVHPSATWRGWYSTAQGLAVLEAQDELPTQLGYVLVRAHAGGRVHTLRQDGLRGERTHRGLVRVCARFLRHLAGVAGPGRHGGGPDPDQLELPLGRHLEVHLDEGMRAGDRVL